MIVCINETLAAISIIMQAPVTANTIIDRIRFLENESVMMPVPNKAVAEAMTVSIPEIFFL